MPIHSNHVDTYNSERGVGMNPSIAAILCLLLLSGSVLAEDTHTAHIKIFCNSTGQIQLVSIDGGSYQTCAGGDCFIELPNTTTRWMPCNDTNASDIVKGVVEELQKNGNFKPLSEERIDSIAINSSTYMKDSWMAWAEGTLLPNVELQEKTKGDLENCTWKLREIETSKQNIVDTHNYEIRGYTERIADLESDNMWYGRILIGGILLALVFLLKEKGIWSKNIFDKTKRRHN